jgi:hypothetical protein
VLLLLVLGLPLRAIGTCGKNPAPHERRFNNGSFMIGAINQNQHLAGL